VAPVVQTVAKAAAPVVQTVTKAAAPVVETVAKAAAPVVQATLPLTQTVATAAAPVTQAVAPVVHAVTEAAAPVAQAIAPVTRTLAPVTTANARAGASGPTSRIGGGAVGVAPTTETEPVPVPSPSTASATTAPATHAEAPTAGTAAPNGTDANLPQPAAPRPARTPERHTAPAAGAHHLAAMNKSAHHATVTELSSPGLAAAGAAQHTSRGLHRAMSTKNRAPSHPAPLGGVSGNGGDGAGAGAAGGSSGAAELSSQTLAGGPSATLALRTYAQRRLPAPFLLLLERPG
jgi:hypothetical protein